jgi:acyl-CoA synthetase (AMP-forming)/AMP-acid ligase II
MSAAGPWSAPTVPTWLRALSDDYGDRSAVVLDDEVLTYRALDESSARLARGLLAHGVAKGARIGILLGNGPGWVVWWAAISRVGAVAVPLSTFLQPAELARVVRHGDLHGLVGARRFLQKDFESIITAALPSLQQAAGSDEQMALPEAPFLRWIVLEGSTTSWSRSRSWIDSAGVSDEWIGVLRAAEEEVHSEDDAIVIYTSGQSADPKGVVHTHASVMTKVHYLREMFGYDRDTVSEATMPFFWVGGLTMGLLPTLDAGGTTVCGERSSWGGAVIGSSAAQDSPYLHLKMIPSLGMTETFGIYAWGHEFPAPGHPIAAPLDELQPGFEIRLVDDHDEAVEDGKLGQIMLRGPTVARRLHKVDRAEAFDADGFYRTGDQGVRTGDRVTFTGRLNDMIKTAGANVSPAEVERELNSIEGIAMAVVVGITDQERGQLVAAAVVPKPGFAPAPSELRNVLAARLSSYKVPRKIVFFSSLDDLPMTPSMKVQKRALADLVLAAEEPDG